MVEGGRVVGEVGDEKVGVVCVGKVGVVGGDGKAEVGEGKAVGVVGVGKVGVVGGVGKVVGGSGSGTVRPWAGAGSWSWSGAVRSWSWSGSGRLWSWSWAGSGSVGRVLSTLFCRRWQMSSTGI